MQQLHSLTSSVEGIPLIGKEGRRRKRRGSEETYADVTAPLAEGLKKSCGILYLTHKSLSHDRKRRLLLI